jgi:hypothetical protein
MALVEISGELYDEETGEYAGPASGWISGNETPEELAHLVLRRKMDIEAQLMAERAKLEAITANVQKGIDAIQRKADWLDRQYAEQVAEYAKSQLPRKADGTYKSKTWTCPWGSVSFRTTAPKLTVVDETAALQVVQALAPEAIKVKQSILVSLIPDNVKAQLADFRGFEVTPAGESVTIKTV